MIAYMDEECLRPGDPTDISLLAKLDQRLDYHKHYISHKKADPKLQKILGRDVKVNYYFNYLKLNLYIITGVPHHSLCRRSYL